MTQDHHKKQKSCSIGSIDPQQTNNAQIIQVNLVLVVCGDGKPGYSFDVLGNHMNFEVNKHGELLLNGEKMDASELEDGIKMYTINKQETK